MLNVFFSVDVEIWCNGWSELDQKFPNAFRRYVYGSGDGGNFGLPYQLRVLNDHGLRGVFFVEPLFSARFGIEPLIEIVDLIREAHQEIQLHLHTEWADEARVPLIKGSQNKRQHLMHFNLEEQKLLIKVGRNLLEAAGAPKVNAFRAGSFACNLDTLLAVSESDILNDSSYNASTFGLKSGLLPGTTAVQPFRQNGLIEYPMTVFHDGTGTLRHAQLAACSFREFEGLLWQALESGHSSFMILSHSAELLNRSRSGPDPNIVKRFHNLCSFLARNSDSFRMQGFHGLHSQLSPIQPAVLTSPIWRTGARFFEQAWSRRS